MKICLIRAQRTFIDCIFASYFIYDEFFVWLEFEKKLSKKYAYLKALLK